MPVAWEDPRRRIRTLIQKLLEETRKISHSYGGNRRYGTKRAPSLRETSKEEGQQQANVFQLQGARRLCKQMSRKGTTKQIV
jgi:hypothetical protein